MGQDVPGGSRFCLRQAPVLQPWLRHATAGIRIWKISAEWIISGA
ncbi:MAG: hypothetical protein NZ602_04130 [Thermoguttaceae bacterium]|nr:hypothetical protein [Thermoguttaceae bacterium]MDW8038334.1 hypothetical protein [Thermoguttaceae bacterium]